MVKVALFDDTDPSITYNGSWNSIGVLKADGPEYNNTLHRTNDNSATVDISFSGTAIAVFGSMQYSQATGVPNSSYVLDENGPIRFNASGTVQFFDSDEIYSHLLLYESGNIADGSHTLKINVDDLSGNGPAYYLDYYTVQVADDTAVDTVIVDDRDPSVLYGGPWIELGGIFEYYQTTARPAQGATANIQFNGTELTVYGTLNGAYADQAVLGFRVDSDDSVNLTIPSTDGLFHQPLFHAAGLARNQMHTVTITSLTTEGIWLDYFTYKTSDASTLGESNNGGNASSNSNDGDDKSNTNIGAIVGGAVGGVAFLILAILGTFLLLRRRKAKQEEEAMEEAKYTEATPYRTYRPSIPTTYSSTTATTNKNARTNRRTNPKTSTNLNPTSNTTNQTMAETISDITSLPPYTGHSPPPPPSTIPSRSTQDSAKPLQDTRYKYDTRFLR